jgi:hypothetical protein
MTHPRHHQPRPHDPTTNHCSNPTTTNRSFTQIRQTSPTLAHGFGAPTSCMISASTPRIIAGPGTDSAFG